MDDIDKAISFAIRRNDPRGLVNSEQIAAITVRAMALDKEEWTDDAVGRIVRDEDMVAMWPQSQVEAIARAVVRELLEVGLPAGNEPFNKHGR